MVHIEGMKKTGKFLSALILGALVPFMTAGLVASVLWAALECGWFWGRKWIEWTFDADGMLTGARSK